MFSFTIHTPKSNAVENAELSRKAPPLSQAIQKLSNEACWKSTPLTLHLQADPIQVLSFLGLKKYSICVVHKPQWVPSVSAWAFSTNKSALILPIIPPPHQPFNLEFINKACALMSVFPCMCVYVHYYYCLALPYRTIHSITCLPHSLLLRFSSCARLRLILPQQSTTSSSPRWHPTTTFCNIVYLTLKNLVISLWWHHLTSQPVSFISTARWQTWLCVRHLIQLVNGQLHQTFKSLIQSFGRLTLERSFIGWPMNIWICCHF